MASETQTLEKNDIVSILIYPCFSEADLGPLPHIWRWSNDDRLVTILIACSHWLLSQRAQFLDVARFLDSPMPKARRLELKSTW